MHTLIIGLDAFDPGNVEKLVGEGKLPNLANLMQQGGYSRFKVADPPQSEISWTSIATGLNPGSHGMFDFVHRDPQSYALNVSLLPTKKSIVGTSFAYPHNARTLFDQAVDEGYPATALWWPATFPAHLDSPVQNIPGLGTPDIHGKLGVGLAFTAEPGMQEETKKTPVIQLKNVGKGRFSGKLKGPAQQKGSSYLETALEFQLDVTNDQHARLTIGEQSLVLTKGKWSPILEITFKVTTFIKLHAVTRVIMNQVGPDPKIYFLPLQIHPLHSPWAYAMPQGFIRRTWNVCGSYLSLGWPQDTTGLEEGWITDDQFLQLCELIHAARRNIFLYHLKDFHEGVLANVFDSLDRIQHMFLRDRFDVIENWYKKYDNLVGLAMNLAEHKGWKDLRLLVVSDHGFSRFDHKVHLNGWLHENGYLVTQAEQSKQNYQSIDWSKTRAYAAGLNSLYLNLQGRESQGIVSPDQRESLSAELKNKLLVLKGPGNTAPVQNILLQDEAFDGVLKEYGPDLVVGYSPGYRASAETGLGNWGESIIEKNTDHWGADHCISSEAVPGVLFCNQGLVDFSKPSYRDIPALAIGRNIKSSGTIKPPPTSGNEDQRIVEERLKSLGYL